MAQRRINQKVRRAVQRYLRILDREEFPVQAVFVFGSRTKNHARKDSDIDVAIISSRLRNSFASAAYLLRKAHEAIGRDELYIEPHGFHPKDFVDENPLVWEIKSTGVRVK